MKHHRSWSPIIARRTIAAARSAWLLLLIGIATPAWANQLTAIDTVSAASNQVTIRLTLADNAPVPSVFTINDPARLSIDLPDTRLDIANRYQQIGQGAVQAVSAVSAGGTTRVVIELSQMVTYNLRRNGHQMLIQFGGQASQVATDSAPPPVAPARPRTVAASHASNRNNTGQNNGAGYAGTASAYGSGDNSGPATAIRNIDFRRSDKGAGQVKIALNGSNAAVDVTEANGKIVANFTGVRLPDSLQRRLDVTDFATPVDTIDAMGNGNNTRITITPESGVDFEQLAYQTGNEFFIELQPLTPAEQAQRQQDNPKFTGKKISLSFQSVDVRQVLQIIADVANVNMVVSDSVTGTMALRLEDVPWDQALDIILNAKGLGMQRDNNVITVAPLPEIAAREQAELVARKATSNLAPLHSEIMQINYASAGDIANILQSNTAAQTPTPGAAGTTILRRDDNPGSLVSGRGRVTVDARTNSLLITESRQQLDKIRRVINQLDTPVRQVLIESRIVVANREFTRNLGISQSVNDTGAFESPTGGNYIANTGYTVGLPVSNAAGTLSTSIIGSTFNLDLALTALETENRGEIISAPRVITANSKQAKIEQGIEIPYLEAASSGAATVQFKDAVLSLEVTPQITPDSRVIMDLFVTQDTQGDSINVQGGGSVPSINTRSLTTQVLVNDGDTVVLGGIYEQENRDVENRIPILGELPLIGNLFRNTSRQRDKRELLIFITPKILREQASVK